MELILTPKPVFDVQKNVIGYYLSFQIGNALLEEANTNTIDVMVNSPFVDFVNNVGLETLTMDNLIFIPVTNVHLTTDLENICTVERSQVVFLLNKKCSLSKVTLERIIRFHDLGFKIAFFSYADFDLFSQFLPYTDYVFCKYETQSLSRILNLIKTNRYKTKVVLKNVDSIEVFNQASALGINYFEGQFYKTRSIGKDNQVSPLQVNYLQLINQVSFDDFDLTKVSKIIQRDTALAIRFLKMVNTSHIRFSKINSIRHAAALIGQNEIKKWIITAVASSLNQEKPDEIIRVSLMRAKFCENMAGPFELGMHQDNLFLMGLFSVLDVILGMHIEKALEMILVPEKVKDALISEKNNFGQVYRFIKHYEQGDWTEVSRIALLNHVSISDIYTAYYDALLWYGKLVNMQIDEDKIKI